jgi:two-component system, chemotaxis family, response regulator Rcp1
MFGSRRLRVLIVEDNKADARLVQSLLEETGVPITVVLAGDGEKAIAIVESVAKGERPAPDLILLDINLPKKNGHEVLASIRELANNAQPFVAMCSGSSSDEDIRRSRNGGADAYLLKPMGMEEMDEIIDRLRTILVLLAETSITSI